MGVDTAFDEGNHCFVIVHDKAEREYNALPMPRSIILPLDKEVIAGVRDLLDEVLRSL